MATAKKTTAKKPTQSNPAPKPRKPRKPKVKNHRFAICRGVEGLCIYMNNYRIVGNKPWGGGSILAEWECSDEDLKRAIEMKGLID